MSGFYYNIALVVFSVLFYWFFIFWLVLVPIIERRINKTYVFRVGFACYLAIATVFPILGLPLALADFFLRWTGGPSISPAMTPHLIQLSRAFTRNLNLLNRNDIMAVSLEFRIDKDGQENKFKVNLRCVERDCAETEYQIELFYFVDTLTPVGGELNVLLDNQITAHSLPSNKLCYDLRRHVLGSQQRTADPAVGYVSIYVIDRTQRPTSITEFNIRKEALSAGGVTVHPPLVTDVAYNGTITLAELLRYAPPYDTWISYGPPAAVTEYREEWRHNNKPVATFTRVNDWDIRRDKPASDSKN